MTTKPAILVIDDSPNRLEWFQDVLGRECNLYLAHSPETALAQFRGTEFDLAFFDHDLGDPEIDGSRLAFRILNNPEEFKAPKSVWVQSSNRVGVDNIRAKFNSVGIPCYALAFENFLRYRDDFKTAVRQLVAGQSVDGNLF